jgi:alcohol dehydrogenase class IV
MTPILGETKDGVKATRSDPKIQPRVVIYDVDLTLTFPARRSGASGLNAMAHAVEALYARDRNPVISLLAREGIRVLSHALPRIGGEQGDQTARCDALYGAWLCGICLGAGGMALHHKLCHALGGAFDVPHAETHAIVLPHALAYNSPGIPEAMTELQAILGDDPALALFEIAGRTGVPRALKSLGMPEEGIELVARRALENPYWNPRPVEYAGLRSLLERAWAGEPPSPGSLA